MTKHDASAARVPSHAQEVSALNEVEVKRDVFRDLPPVYPEPRWSVQIIQTPAALERYAAKIAKLSEIAIDTETFGRGEEPINTNLSLIQIGFPAVENGKVNLEKGETVLIDALALITLAEEQTLRTGVSTNPLEPLRKVMENPNITKIVQHKQFEADQLDKFGIKLQGIVDTESLAKELRPDLTNHSMAALGVELLGFSVNKAEQKKDWSERPLSKAKLVYAALDPEITCKLKHLLCGLQEQTVVDKTLPAAEAMDKILELERAKLQLMRPIANEYGVAGLKMQSLRFRLKTLLIHQAEERGVGERSEFIHKDPTYGSAKISRNADTLPNPTMLRKILPGVAEQIIYEEIFEKDLLQVMKKRGFSSEDIAEVLENVKESIGRTAPTLSLSLNYDNFYSADDSTLERPRVPWRTKNISTLKELEKFVASASESSVISYSSERDPNKGGLGTISLAIPNKRRQGGQVAVIDVRALEKEAHLLEKAGRGKKDVNPLAALEPLLENPSITKIVHHFSDEKRRLERFGISISNHFDIQESAKVVRPDLPQHSMAICAAEIAGKLLVRGDIAGDTQMRFELHEKLAALAKDAALDRKFLRTAPFEELFPEIMGEIIRMRGEQLRLRRNIGNDYEILNRKIEGHREGIKKQLVDLAEERQEPAQKLEGASGTASLHSQQKWDINVDALKEKYPDLARAKVFDEKRKRERSLVFETFKKDDVAKVIDELRPQFRDRLFEQLFDVVGYESPSVSIWPKFSKLYSIEESPAAHDTTRPAEEDPSL